MQKKKFYETKWFMWLWLILFPPIGITLVWVCHKEMKQNTKIIFSVVFAIWFIILCSSMNDDNNSSSNTDTKNQSQTTVNETKFKETTSSIAETKTEETTSMKEEITTTKKEETTTKKKDIKAQLKEKVVDTIGKDKLSDFSYLKNVDYVFIEIKGSESLTNKMTVKGMYYNIFDVLKAIQPIIDKDVIFNITYPLQDEYGNSEDTLVINASFKKKTIKKINFENAIADNIPNMADSWWQHNALNVD